MSHSHTPTPWKASAHDVKSSDGKKICNVWTGDNDCEMAEANAAYIVKAVNEHETLVRQNIAADDLIKELVEALENIVNSLGGWGGDTEILDNAKSAIAAARGEK